MSHTYKHKTTTFICNGDLSGDVTIVTKNKEEEWNYKPNTEIIIPVLAVSAYRALIKVKEKYSGSEYPAYETKSIAKCDDFLFKPMINN